MRGGRSLKSGWRWLGMLVVACALPLSSVQPAQAAPVDLVNTGTYTYDRWQLQPGKFFAYPFEATGTATATSATVLFGDSPVDADLVGSKVSICTGYPAAPADSSTCFGSLNFSSLAADVVHPTLKRATFTGSVVITPGTYWFKVHDVPAGRSAWIRHGGLRNAGAWNVLGAAGVINWAAITQYSTTPETRVYLNNGNWYTGMFTLSGVLDSSSGSLGGDDSTEFAREEPVNRAVMQQYARAAGEKCPAGWGESWAQWPHDYSGGYVCSRTVRWDDVLSEWMPA